MTIKYTNIFHSKALQFGKFGMNIRVAKPCLELVLNHEIVCPRLHFSLRGASATSTDSYYQCYVYSCHKTKSHICPHRQSFMEWLSLECIGDKKTLFRTLFFRTKVTTPFHRMNERQLGTSGQLLLYA
jgi:hypothetical protein